MKYIYIPTGNKSEFMGSGVDCNQIVRIIGGQTVVIHSSKQAIFSFTHIEGITLVAGEEVDEIAGGASGIR